MLRRIYLGYRKCEWPPQTERRARQDWRQYLSRKLMRRTALKADVARQGAGGSRRARSALARPAAIHLAQYMYSLVNQTQPDDVSI